MTLRNTNLRVLIVLTLVLTLTACSDGQLTKLSQSLDDVAKGVGAAQSIVIAAQAQGNMSVDDTARILQLCAKINTAGQQATAVTRKITSLDAASRGNILAILQPIVSAVNDAVSNGTVGITNQTVKQTLQAALVAIQTGLSAAQVVIAGGK